MRVRFALVLALAGTLATFASEKDKIKTTQRLDDAAVVFSEIMGTPDKGIPQELLDKSYCVVIVPGLKKGAFIIGAKYGKGFVSCRKAGGTGWTAPATVRVEGGSIGLQIGGAETDVVMLVMNERGMQKLMSSKFTLGGEGEVAAGPDLAQFLHDQLRDFLFRKGVMAGVDQFAEGFILHRFRCESAPGDSRSRTGGYELAAV